MSRALELLGQNEHNCLRLAELEKKYTVNPHSEYHGVLGSNPWEDRL